MTTMQAADWLRAEWLPCGVVPRWLGFCPTMDRRRPISRPRRERVDYHLHWQVAGSSELVHPRGCQRLESGDQVLLAGATPTKIGRAHV